ncbi:hypothetical protein BJ170DRAFT_596657 [Xylariales sp. AK1849]|nr:hypothetical protein BJ170DRAFT_596657 [Xylariales sp. AK1849]
MPPKGSVWGPDDIIKLLMTIIARDHPGLAMEGWKAIAAEMGFGVDTVKKQFAKLRKEFQEQNGSGNGDGIGNDHGEGSNDKPAPAKTTKRKRATATEDAVYDGASENSKPKKRAAKPNKGKKAATGTAAED